MLGLGKRLPVPIQFRPRFATGLDTVEVAAQVVNSIGLGHGLKQPY